MWCLILAAATKHEVERGKKHLKWCFSRVCFTESLHPGGDPAHPVHSSRIHDTATKGFPWSATCELRKRAIFVPSQLLYWLWFSLSSSVAQQPAPAYQSRVTLLNITTFKQLRSVLTLLTVPSTSPSWTSVASSQYKHAVNIPLSRCQAY